VNLNRQARARYLADLELMERGGAQSRSWMSVLLLVMAYLGICVVVGGWLVMVWLTAQWAGQSIGRLLSTAGQW
jgi:Tfp pilus assembly protein PilN